MSTKHVLDHAEDAATLLAAMGNTKRLMILCHLLDGELSVGQIAHAVDLSQSALSQHLAKLRRLQIVSTRRDKQIAP
jgi:DNA-binding transcriptional ArsR family regulator